MESANQHQAASSTGRQSLTAFLLGWSISEALGLFRKGAAPRGKPSGPSPDYAPRLTPSQGYIERSVDSVVLTLERVVHLSLGLGFTSHEAAQGLTTQVYALPQQARAWLEGKSEKFMSPSELRELLNGWSLEIWAWLGGASPNSAQAFTAGMSLADTYWYMRPPKRRPQGASVRLSAENWRRLLSQYRLSVESSRLLRLAHDLPPYVVPVIRSHLAQWGIGTHLGYQDGKLALFRNAEQTGELSPEDETKMQQALGRQFLYWNAMLFGFREAATYLSWSERWWVQLVSAIGFGIALALNSALLVLALVSVGYLLIVGVLPFVQPLLSQLLVGQQVKVSDVVSIANLLWTLLIALRLPQLVSVAYRGARNAQRWIEDQMTVQLIARRTYVPWNRYLQ